jgi:hypothetical protein
MIIHGLFNGGFVAGMAAMWFLQRLIGARRCRRGEDAALRAELEGSGRSKADEIEALHARLAVLERIATDPAERTAREIEALRG